MCDAYSICTRSQSHVSGKNDRTSEPLLLTAKSAWVVVGIPVAESAFKRYWSYTDKSI